MQNRKNNHSHTQFFKPAKQKPQWTTDFIDRDQYKLSQIQRIQKKASLQSKNREQAKRQLEERRKKLQMGIIDDQTQKIFETALISKNIDINPTIRRNLTEMIKYEKQQKKRDQHENESENGADPDNEENLGGKDQSKKQLEQAQDFIKKFQKAKKQQHIERAVQILTYNKRLSNQQRFAQKKDNESHSRNFTADSREKNVELLKDEYGQKRSNKSLMLSQDDALSNIEDTIRFMEEKLFATKKIVDEHSKSFISQQNEAFDKESIIEFQLEDRQAVARKFKKPQKGGKQIIYSKQPNFGMSGNLQFGNNIEEISQLKIRLKDSDEAQSDNECLQTIRRMRQLLDNKENENGDDEENQTKYKVRDNIFLSSQGGIGFQSTTSKRSFQQGMDSEAEVSFSLTLNQDEFQQGNSIQADNFNMKRSFENDDSKRQMENGTKKQFFKKVGANCPQEQHRITKQEQYQKEYQVIKQNLFSCLNQDNKSASRKSNKQTGYSPQVAPTLSNLHSDLDDCQESEDSLIIQNKINMWKQEFEHQADPDDQIPPSQSMTKLNVKHPQSRKIEKQSYEQDPEDPRQSQKSHWSSVHKNQNNNFLNKNLEQTNLKNENSQKFDMKKPPLGKKSQTSTKFQEMKKMISNASTQIKKIQIQPLKIESLGAKEVIGFDFSGSINIKKNMK